MIKVVLTLIAIVLFVAGLWMIHPGLLLIFAAWCLAALIIGA